MVHHGSVVLPHLHTAVLAMIPAIDSLRSSIAKVAMALVREMCQFMGKVGRCKLIPVLKAPGSNAWDSLRY